ncbi:unnamed protein product [Rhizopus microsporus]
MKTSREPSQPKATNIIRPSYKRGPPSVISTGSSNSVASQRKPRVAATTIVEKPGFNIYSPHKKQPNLYNASTSTTSSSNSNVSNTSNNNTLRPVVEIYKPPTLQR